VEIFHFQPIFQSCGYTGGQVQQVEIHYNGVAVIELPDMNETNSKTA
jgi:hypothetical protein